MKLTIVVCIGSEVCSLMLHVVVHNNRINDTSGHIIVTHDLKQLLRLTGKQRKNNLLK